MKKFLLGLFLIGLFVFIVLLSLRIPATFISSFDGNNKNADGNYTNEVKLSNGLFLDSKGRILLKKINQNLSEIIIKDRIDSLCWNVTKIIGYANKRYFIVELNDSLKTNCKFFVRVVDLKRDSTILKIKYTKFFRIPVVSGLSVKDTIFD
jgi:hypothetical protein